jgi:hypothetical protein
MGGGLQVMPCDLAEANAFVGALHRHHKPVVGHKFSLACVDASGLVRGVCIVGRPVARLAGDKHHVCEVSRLCTDGAPNACSILYGAAARTAKAMGFVRIQTYTLPIEGGASLRASGWVCEGRAGGGQWSHTDGKDRRADQPTEVKARWSKTFSVQPKAFRLPAVATDTSQGDLLGSA